MNPIIWLAPIAAVLALLFAAYKASVVSKAKNGNAHMYIFGVDLGWLPTFGLTSPAHYILPVFALSFYPMSYITRLMRSSMKICLGRMPEYTHLTDSHYSACWLLDKAEFERQGEEKA